MIKIDIFSVIFGFQISFRIKFPLWSLFPHTQSALNRWIEFGHFHTGLLFKTPTHTHTGGSDYAARLQLHSAALSGGTAAAALSLVLFGCLSILPAWRVPSHHYTLTLFLSLYRSQSAWLMYWASQSSCNFFIHLQHLTRISGSISGGGHSWKIISNILLIANRYLIDSIGEDS